MKKLIKKGFHLVNLEVSRKRTPDSAENIVGDFRSFLAGVKARGLKCTSLLDIGANRAEWSSMFLEVYPGAHCYLVEPLQECESHLKKFVSRNKDSRYFLCAAGSENTETIITIWDDLYGSSLLPNADKNKLQQGKQRVIEVKKVNDLIRDNGIPVPQIVKIDVQGFELEVLKGAGDLLGKTEIFILEVSLFSFDDVPGMPEFYDVVHFMHQKGYVAYDFPGFIRRPYDGALGQCDIAFVKKDSFLRSSRRWK
jgi:FkbM family methyltransferase